MELDSDAPYVNAGCVRGRLFGVREKEHTHLMFVLARRSPRAPSALESVTELVKHSPSTYAPRSCKLGYIDVNSGALEVSKLGTYL